jgi:hypothetical protein
LRFYPGPEHISSFSVLFMKLFDAGEHIRRDSSTDGDEKLKAFTNFYTSSILKPSTDN